MRLKRRWLPLVMIAALGVAATGCGSDSSSDSSTAASGGVDVAGAQAQIDQFSAVPEFVAPGAEVDAAAAKGKTLAIVPASSNVPFVNTIANNMVDVGTVAGLTVTRFNNQGTPAEWAKGVSDAISRKSDSIDLLAGLDPAAVSAQVRQAKGKGIPVVATHLYDVDQAVNPNLAAATNIPYEQAGRLLADWVITKTEGKAKVLVTTINQVNSTVPMMAGIEDEFATRCGDGCSIVKIDTTIADLGKLQQQVQSALTSNADINYVINLYDSAQAPQTEAAIKTLGKDLKIATFNGTPDILKLITPDSVIQMDVGENLEWIAYAAVDQHLRLLSGADPTTTPNVPIRVFDATNVGEFDGGRRRLRHLLPRRLRGALGAEVAPPGPDARAAEGPPALSLRGVSKHFGGAQALLKADLTIRAGEVHGLLGENGSGKSTLIKILAGFHEPDSGELEFAGRTVPLPLPPGRFRELGIGFVHQDLALIPTLTVVENLRTGLIARSGSLRSISWRGEARRASAVFERYGLALDPTATVADLRPVDRALLAIVRAIEDVRGEHEGPGILVLDEPTVFLPRSEVEHLFSLVREIAASGGSVLFVSHDLSEVGDITDRVTVLRDGRVVGTAVTAETDESRLVEMIIGRRLSAFAGAHRDHAGEAPVASVTGLAGPGIEDASLSVAEGEVLGLTGLAGSGFEAVPYLLTGAWTASAGRLRLDGDDHDLTRMTPGRALRARIALIPGDRQRDGAVGSLSVTDNLTLPRLPRFRAHGTLGRGRMHRLTAEAMERFDVRPPAPRADYGSFSGGNQQKALLAKWLDTSPRLLLVHEPTQGVDIGARQQIFATIRAVADRGACMVLASSDHEQLAQICDRVLVFGRGRIVSELRGDDVVKDRITEQCYAVAEAGSPR